MPQVILWTSGEVAEHLRVHISTVRKWNREGLLKAVTLPGRSRNAAKRYRRDEVERCIAFLPVPKSTQV